MLLLALSSALLGGCEPGSGTSSAADRSSTPPAAEQSTRTRNLLGLRIDGKPWQADREIFAAIHPPGLPRSVVISGSLGPKDRNEQVFSLIVQGVDGPGSYRVDSGNPDGSAAQIGNLSPDRYLIGNVLGFDLTVNVETMSTSPLALDLRFSGRMTDNTGVAVEITDGRFSYRE